MLCFIQFDDDHEKELLGEKIFELLCSGEVWLGLPHFSIMKILLDEA